MRPTNFSSPFSSNKSVIRVVQTTKTGFVDPRVDESVVWQGHDTDQLSREFPPSDIWGADPFGHKEIEDGWIRWDFRFEKLLEDGTWEEIDDPRRRLTPKTNLEREIDAENRRLYPGDFITDDECDRCGGYGCDECEDPQSYDDYEEDDVPDEPEYDCEYCHDFGCARCEPEKHCMSCQVELSDGENGLCTECQNYYDDMSKEHCRLCSKELSPGEDWICGDCEHEEHWAYAVYKEWWVNPEDSRAKRIASWCHWVVYRLRHRIKHQR